MRVKIFTFNLTTFGRAEDNATEFTTHEIAEDTINDFIYGLEPDYQVVDIKVNTYEARFHNNGGVPLVKVIYTILYK